MKFRTLAIAAMALLLPFATACSSNSTGDLSTGKISEQLQKGGLTKTEADCMAPIVKQANLTERELNQISPTDPNSKNTRAGKVFIGAFKKCVPRITTTSTP